MGRRYPLRVDDQRDFAADFEGRVFVWDIDKTYLATGFSSLKGLSRIPVEFAVDKRAIPGMPEVLRGLRRGPGPGFACAPLYFVSASPPQMRRVLQRKMLLDGVEYDGIIFKDWVGVLTGLKPGRLKQQAGFKLCALLTGRQRRPRSRELLFGDDVEQDAEAFDLYARLVSGEVEGDAAEEAMTEVGIADDDRACIRDLLASTSPGTGDVERIFIHLERGTSPTYFERFGRRVVPVQGAVQLALALYGLDLVQAESVQQVCDAVIAELPRVDIDGLVEDAVDRGLVDQGRVAQVGW
ncbi:MAG: phosphatase domain-containing protein [Myxococcota bacterium]